MLVMIAGLLTLLQNGWIIFNQLVLLEWMFDDVISSDTYSIIATAAYNLFYLAISGLLLFLCAKLSAPRHPHRWNPPPSAISRPIEAAWC